jgi:hypothetical protein
VVLGTGQADEAAQIVLRLERCLASRVAAAHAERADGVSTVATSVAPRSDDLTPSHISPAKSDALVVGLWFHTGVLAFALTVVAFVWFGRGFATALTAFAAITGTVVTARHIRLAMWATIGVVLGGVTAWLS